MEISKQVQLWTLLLLANLSGEITGFHGTSTSQSYDENYTVAKRPSFDPYVPRNVTAVAGKSAYLACRVYDLGDKTVSWLRHRDIHILTVGTYTYTSDDRFQALHQEESEEWILHIKWAKQEDAGMYECQISTQPVNSYFVYLSIIGKDVGRSRPMSQVWSPYKASLQQEIDQRMYADQVPTAAIAGESELHVDKGSTINLTCIVRFSPEPPSYITWLHQDGLIPNDRPQTRISVKTNVGEVTTSRLLVYDADITDSGKYTCMPSNADETSIKVHVLSGELPAAMQTGSAKMHAYQTGILNICCTLFVVCFKLTR